jgi:glutamate-1-semialdehyde 2,1-aminomutase
MVTSRQMTIEEEYVAKRPKSAELAARARGILIDGATHDIRRLLPFQPYAARAKGSRKWDVDGNEYIDFCSAHGALMFGHGREEIVDAVREQALKGTHYSLCTELEIEWAEWIKKLMPSMEEIRFHSSGTEACLMSFRLARAYTGKTKILKFQGHFHGWQDYSTPATVPPWDVPISIGIPKETVSTMVALPPNDIAAVEQVFAGGDIAAVVLEPTGCDMGRVPIGAEFLRQLRELTAKKGVVLIMDEVVTGFRISPRGVQGALGITPDLTTLAKIVAGGLPGGCVGGKKEIMDGLRFHADAESNRFKRMAHPGTFNANPLSAAAGVACLKLVDEGSGNAHAYEMCDRMKAGLQGVMAKRGVPGIVYGGQSILHCYLGSDLEPANMLTAKTFSEQKVELAMLVEGVHFLGHRILLNASHSEADVDTAVAAFDRVIGRLQQEGAL